MNIWIPKNVVNAVGQYWVKFKRVPKMVKVKTKDVIIDIAGG